MNMNMAEDRYRVFLTGYHQQQIAAAIGGDDLCDLGELGRGTGMLIGDNTGETGGCIGAVKLNFSAGSGTPIWRS